MLEVEGRPGGAGRAAVCRGSGGAGRGLAVKRGDIVAVSLQGDYGKPRPALIVQSNLLAELESLVICPITSAVRDAAFRITVEPDNANGLRVLRSEEHTSELQSLMRISYAVFCLKKKKTKIQAVKPDIYISQHYHLSSNTRSVHQSVDTIIVKQ